MGSVKTLSLLPAGASLGAEPGPHTAKKLVMLGDAWTFFPKPMDSTGIWTDVSTNEN